MLVLVGDRSHIQIEEKQAMSATVTVFSFIDFLIKCEKRPPPNRIGRVRPGRTGAIYSTVSPIFTFKIKIRGLGYDDNAIIFLVQGLVGQASS